MRARLRRFVPDGSRGRLREAGGTYGPWRPKRDLIQRVLARTDEMGVGPKLIVQRESDDEELSIREVRTLFVPDLNAAPQLEVVRARIFASFGDNLRDAGIWYCRFVDGTRTVSRHGRREAKANGWLGAANDLFVRSGGMTALEEVADFTVDLHRQGEAPALSTVIVNRRVWTSDGGWHGYSGAQHFHEHYDFDLGVACTP